MGKFRIAAAMTFKVIAAPGVKITQSFVDRLKKALESVSKEYEVSFTPEMVVIDIADKTSLPETYAKIEELVNSLIDHGKLSELRTKLIELTPELLNDPRFNLIEGAFTNLVNMVNAVKEGSIPISTVQDAVPKVATIKNPNNTDREKVRQDSLLGLLPGQGKAKAITPTEAGALPDSYLQARDGNVYGSST